MPDSSILALRSAGTSSFSMYTSTSLERGAKDGAVTANPRGATVCLLQELRVRRHLTDTLSVELAFEPSYKLAACEDIQFV